jgi:hypothetical protein
MTLAALVVLLICATPATEDYLLVFAADSIPYRPTGGHSFAALVRVEQSPGCPPRIVTFVSLSWLPESMHVRALAPWCEKGRNVPLDETLRHYQASGSRICMWGPYRVQPELAEKFIARVAHVESKCKYKGACLISRRGVCDCTRSVEEMIGRRRYIGCFGYGAAASSVIVRTFSPWLVEPEHAHLWVVELLGLDTYPLVWRPFGDYTSRLDQLGASIHGR